MKYCWEIQRPNYEENNVTWKFPHLIYYRNFYSSFTPPSLFAFLVICFCKWLFLVMIIAVFCGEWRTKIVKFCKAKEKPIATLKFLKKFQFPILELCVLQQNMSITYKWTCDMSIYLKFTEIKRSSCSQYSELIQFLAWLFLLPSSPLQSCSIIHSFIHSFLSIHT